MMCSLNPHWLHPSAKALPGHLGSEKHHRCEFIGRPKRPGESPFFTMQTQPALRVTCMVVFNGAETAFFLFVCKEPNHFLLWFKMTNL
jgi:hypothetical protein